MGLHARHVQDGAPKRKHTGCGFVIDVCRMARSEKERKTEGERSSGAFRELCGGVFWWPWWWLEGGGVDLC